MAMNSPRGQVGEELAGELPDALFCRPILVVNLQEGLDLPCSVGHDNLVGEEVKEGGLSPFLLLLFSGGQDSDRV